MPKDQGTRAQKRGSSAKKRVQNPNRELQADSRIAKEPRRNPGHLTRNIRVKKSLAGISRKKEETSLQRGKGDRAARTGGE